MFIFEVWHFVEHFKPDFLHLHLFVMQVPLQELGVFPFTAEAFQLLFLRAACMIEISSISSVSIFEKQPCLLLVIPCHKL